MGDLSAYSVWSAVNIIAVILMALLLSNILKKSISVLRKSLIPTSVLAGLILMLVAVVYNLITGELLFNQEFFGGKGYDFLEIIAYHMLALGFIASTLQSSNKKMTKQRSKEIFDSGITTVATYLLQGVVGIGITILATALFMPSFFEAAGVLLPFGYGQGTGQALNYGNIFESQYGFEGGKSFGLTVAAFGFLSASLGGVIHLVILKKRNPKLIENINNKKVSKGIVMGDDSKDGSLGKLTVQIILCVLAYFITYLVMLGLGKLIPSLISVVYGFNFLFGVLAAMGIKAVINFLRKKRVIKQKVTNNYLLSNVANFCFDLMIVAGIGAIRLDIIGKYWAVLLVLGIAGLVITYFYTRIIAKTLFPSYCEEQFLATFGMLTGTASTGIVLLREIDPDFQTDAANNLVYQTLPAMVFGFPMMFLAPFAPEHPILTLIIMAGLLVVMNIILFRSKIFRRRKKACAFVGAESVETATTEETTAEE